MPSPDSPSVVEYIEPGALQQHQHEKRQGLPMQTDPNGKAPDLTCLRYMHGIFSLWSPSRLRRGPLTKQVASFFRWTALAHPEPPTSDLETASVPAPWGALAASTKKPFRPSKSNADTGCYRLQKLEGFTTGMGWNGFQILDNPVCSSESLPPSR
ncbi:hypothetical protein FAVG1_05584 [Fusarium avenaceum]|nr:hypothetical protein FAVG1_05584 [Fusarium avenaceum]